MENGQVLTGHITRFLLYYQIFTVENLNVDIQKLVRTDGLKKF